MRYLLFAAVILLGCSTKNSVDLGGFVAKEPPRPETVKLPQSDDGIPQVALRTVVRGKLSSQQGEDGQAVYVLVNPLSNPKTKNVWWVQERVQRVGDEFQVAAQFGEQSQGAGEYFAVIGVVTSAKNPLRVGQRLKGLPKGQWYTKVRVVIRNPN